MLAVHAVNQVPVVESDSYSTFKNTSLTFNPLLNDWDPEGQNLMITAWALLPKLGNVSSTADSNGFFTYMPRSDADGLDTFSYVASDGNMTSTGTVTVTIGKHSAMQSWALPKPGHTGTG